MKIETVEIFAAKDSTPEELKVRKRSHVSHGQPITFLTALTGERLFKVVGKETSSIFLLWGTDSLDV